MLKNKLIDLINKNEVWAFVGSGPSVDSGYPSWNKLIDIIIEGIENRDSILKDIEFQRYRNRGNYPECFSIIENSSSREYIEKKLKDILTTQKRLERGDKVKVSIRFRGREMQHKDLGMDLLNRIRDELPEGHIVEQMPRLEGRQMSMTVALSKQK